MESFFYQASLYLGIAVIAVPLAMRFGLGSVLGYLAAGVMIGPVLGLVGNETAELQHFAEFGVVMMLFLIGLELEPKALWGMRHRLLGLGGLQITATLGLTAAGALALGLPPAQALAVGMVFALSSTAIVLQTLSEKGLMQTNGGRSSFSVLLTQDIAVIPMLALLPLLAQPGLNTGLATGGHHAGENLAADAPERTAEAAVSLVQNLPGWGITLATLAAIGLIVLFGTYGTRPVFRFLHRAHLRELYVAFALFIVISIAFVMTLVGLSPALGTFLAGVVLANSEFRHQLEADIEPFKGLLLGLFFITVGAGIDFGIFLAQPMQILGITLAIMTIKGLVLFVLAMVFGIRGRDRWLLALGLAQAGEFGFVLVSFALSTNVLPVALADNLLLIVALSMLLTPLAFIAYEHLSRRIGDAGTAPDPDEIDDRQPVIIAGIGRFGQVVNRMLQMSGFRTTVMDNNLETIQLMRKFGFKGFFGDPTRPELLHAAGLADARVLVVALDDPKAALKLVRYARQERPDLHIVARARDRVHTYELYAAGADHIVRELFDSSLRAARYVLESMGIPDHEAKEMEHEFFRLDRRSLRELADLWQPGVPIEHNTAYIERARSLNKELETAFIRRGDAEARDDD